MSNHPQQHAPQQRDQSQTGIDENCAFVTELGRGLHEAGISAPRLEDSLNMVSERLKVQGQFFVTPTSLWAGYGPMHDQRVVLARVEPADVNLGRLAAIDAIADDVASGEITSREGSERLEAVRSAPLTFAGWPQVITLSAVGASVAVLLGGGFPESIAASAIGLCVGGLRTIADRHKRVGRLMEFLAGFVCVVAAIALSGPLGGLSISIVVLAGLISLVPGLTLTLAITELAARHLISGTARFTHAIMIFVSIGFGIALGTRIGESVFTPLDRAATPAPSWMFIAALAAAPVAFTVMFRARWRDLPGIAAAGMIGFFGTRLGTDLLGPELGACVGAFLLGSFSNAVARFTAKPASITGLPGIMLLVPGSVGMQSLSALLKDDVTGGVQTAFTMLLIAVSLVAGLLLANIAVSPRRSL